MEVYVSQFKMDKKRHIVDDRTTLRRLNQFNIDVVIVPPNDTDSSSEGDDPESAPPMYSYQSSGSLRYESSGGNHTRSSSDDESTFFTTIYNPPKPLPSGLVGLQNQGATCYLNSLIQSLYMTPEFRRMIYTFERPWEKLLKQLERKHSEACEDIILQMQMLFARMQTSNGEPVSTSGLTVSFGWDSADNFVQHDVQELNRILCDRLEDKMKGNIKEGSHNIAGLYRGNMVNMIKCTACGRISTREEDFYDISLVVRGRGMCMSH